MKIKHVVLVYMAMGATSAIAACYVGKVKTGCGAQSVGNASFCPDAQDNPNRYDIRIGKISEAVTAEYGGWDTKLNVTLNCVQKKVYNECPTSGYQKPDETVSTPTSTTSPGGYWCG